MYDMNIGPTLIVLGIVCGIIGWAAIEGALWVLHHISFAWN